ncbi:hypothetical protein CFOL_v3_15034 [Cephalotus follicularis]|uniref:Transmembrane protein n=1 Tax=Cephalotus follicularis TaxID=3775 RepID=A0A1Q3BUH4_CEPFO|nr:hypothetical protein CFOL_v3_15034 [Cephalotus follicularis]
MKEWSLVAIKDRSHKNNNNNDLSIFPPNNHENLHIPSQQHSNQQQQKQKQFDAYRLAPPRSPIKCLGIGFEVLRAKICSIAASFWSYNDDSARGSVWSFLPAAGVALMLTMWWLSRRLRRQSRDRLNMDRLMVAIKERDEKIIQLLHHIVQMNEVLLAHHKIPASKLAN